MREHYISYCLGVALYAMMMTLLCCGCKTTHPAVMPEVVETNNKTDTKIVHIETIDTVFIKIPAQSAERTTPEEVSHLETDYAESDARINADGTLTHTLRNKSTPVSVSVRKTTDTVYVEKTIEKPVPVKVPVEVERKLTRWEKTRLDTWGWIVAALVAGIAWQYRNRLWQLIRRSLDILKP